MRSWPFLSFMMWLGPFGPTKKVTGARICRVRGSSGETDEVGRHVEVYGPRLKRIPFGDDGEVQQTESRWVDATFTEIAEERDCRWH